ncbi:hypothetical protein BGZ96_000419 [Linnemannia gamsii]|uniref:Uncharacterized protein n=1 Tax=Linnemannia gamsii TaxID=64522 RepID=A0ABQ7JPD8_9FUNG|nr:hypothetical protein BGZ96_000419 [Linnemannia gamsii]
MGQHSTRPISRRQHGQERNFRHGLFVTSQSALFEHADVSRSVRHIGPKPASRRLRGPDFDAQNHVVEIWGIWRIDVFASQRRGGVTKFSEKHNDNKRPTNTYFPHGELERLRLAARELKADIETRENQEELARQEVNKKKQERLKAAQLEVARLKEKRVAAAVLLKTEELPSLHTAMQLEAMQLEAMQLEAMQLKTMQLKTMQLKETRLKEPQLK